MTKSNIYHPAYPMEVILADANQTLERALAADKVNGFPESFFPHVVGICILFSTEFGFIMLGSIGARMLFKKQNDSTFGLWVHWIRCAGLQVGMSAKDVIVFIFEEGDLQAFSSEHGIKMVLQSELAVGPWGRSFRMDGQVSRQNIGSKLAIAYSKDALASTP